MVTQRKFVHVAKNKAGDEIPLIGYTIAWSYSRAEFLHTDVIGAFQNHNLETSHLNKGKDRISAVLRALNKAKKDALLRQCDESPTTIRYQFTEEFFDEMPDGTRFKNFKLSEFIVYDKVNDKILADTTEKQEMLQELMNYCAERFTNSDVTRYTKKLFEKSGIISLRSRGGMYFVPAPHSQLVLNVMQMFMELDPKGEFTLIEMPDLTFTKESVKNNFDSDMKSRMEELQKKMELIKEKGETMTRTVYKNLIEEIGQWSKDVEMYAELTEYNLDSAKQMVKDSIAMVMKFNETGSI